MPADRRAGEQADALARPAFPDWLKLRLGQRHLLLHQGGDVAGEVTYHLAEAAAVLGLQCRPARGPAWDVSAGKLEYSVIGWRRRIRCSRRWCRCSPAPGVVPV